VLATERGFGEKKGVTGPLVVALVVADSRADRVRCRTGRLLIFDLK
jgi:hypothetical protein